MQLGQKWPHCIEIYRRKWCELLGHLDIMSSIGYNDSTIISGGELCKKISSQVLNSGNAENADKQKYYRSLPLFMQKNSEDKIIGNILVGNAQSQFMQQECAKQEKPTHKNIRSINANIGRCILKNVNDKKGKAINGQKQQYSMLMAERNAFVVKKQNIQCLPLTISTMMEQNIGIKSMEDSVDKKALIFMYGLNKTISQKDFKSSVITAMSANTAIKEFVPINLRKVQRLSERSRNQAIPKRTTPLNGEDIVPSLEQSKVVSQRDRQRIANSVEDYASGKMSEQRVPYSVREEARLALTDWWAERIDTSMMNQLAGNTNQSDARFTGMQACTAPTNDHWILATGVAGTNTEASLSASSIFSLTLIDRAVVKAKTLSPKIRPLRIDGEEKYVSFIHTYQHHQLRTNTNTAQYADIQKAAIQGGQISKNPIYTGSLAEYNGTVMHESTRVPTPGVTSVYRAIFCGAQAGVFALGQDSNTNLTASWFEELRTKGSSLKNCVNSVELSLRQCRAKLDFIIRTCYDYCINLKWRIQYENKNLQEMWT